MKKLSSLMAIFFLIVCANAQADEDKSVLLTLSQGGVYSTLSAYSFYQNVQGAGITPDIYFTGDSFILGTGGWSGGYGSIADLGAMSCKDIRNQYETMGDGYPTKEDRINKPMLWFDYSDAMDALSHKTTSAEVDVKEGHCYALALTHANIGESVIAVFHTKNFMPNVSTEINEIEVFQRATLTPVSKPN